MKKPVLLKKDAASKREIIREYQKTLEKMGVRKWAGFLDKDWWTRDHYKGDPVYGNGKYYGKQEYNSDWGTCNVCGSKQHGQYIGSHFRQCFKKLEEHQKAVSLYDNLLKKVFNSVLEKYGYKLRGEPEKGIYNPLWETARKYVGSALYGWSKAIESIEQNDKDIEEEKRLIKQAKQHITELPPDYHLANYILRDSPIVKKTKSLGDFSWAIHQSSSVAKDDVLSLIELIEKEMENNMEK